MCTGQDVTPFVQINLSHILPVFALIRASQRGRKNFFYGCLLFESTFRTQRPLCRQGFVHTLFNKIWTKSKDNCIYFKCPKWGTFSN